MNPLLRITNLTIRKGAKILLHLPSLDIFKGAIYGIIGESGSGKSLTLLAAMGLLPNEINAQGLVEWNGLNLLEFSQSQWMAIRNKQIGMVFQEPMTALNPQMTCGEQLIESVLVHSKPTKPELKKILSEALLEVGLTDVDRFLVSYPHQISGGQRQRIMIAMATIHKPLLVLADEPTTALDPETGKAVMDVLVQRCKKTGSALLLVSHDLHLIREIAEYVSVFRKGECLAQGNVSEVFSLHPHSYVSELINASPSGGRDDIKETVEKLEVKDIVKSYRTGKKELKVLQHISFTLNKGETLAILGGSGTGKSTIAKILTGLEKADGGQIIFNGNNIGNRKNTGIQMVFQDPFASLNQNLTNLEAVAEVLRVKGYDKFSAKTKAMDLILSVGLTEDQMLAYPQNLSGGQRQRLCIARALASSPDVLILDEAVAALDPLVQKQVLDLLKEIQTKTNIIYIFITHNLEVAASFAHQTIRLNMAAVVH